MTRQDLCLLLEPETRRESLIRETAELPAHTLSPSQIVDLEALMVGAFSPLAGYMTEADYNSVLASSTLTSGVSYPMPITLAVSPETAEVPLGARLLLRDEEGTPLALLDVQSKWRPDKEAEAEALYGDARHPAADILRTTGPVYLGGPVVGIQLPKHYDFTHLRGVPQAIRAELTRPTMGYVASRVPHGGAHLALTEAAESAGMELLIAVLAGDDLHEPVPYAVRARLYEPFLQRLTGARMCVMPVAGRGACGRNLLWQATILRNYGCEAVVVDASLETAEDVALLRDFADREGFPLLLLPEPGYDVDGGRWSREKEKPRINTAGLFEKLEHGDELDHWMVHPDDVGRLRAAFPPRSKQGFVLFFTGLSGAGKSTVAKALCAALGAYDRPVTLLDGDVVRLNLSKGLGFSKEDRDTNIRRIGYVASLVAKSGGAAICAPIAPYRATRAETRRMVGAGARFVEVHVAADLATCEARDPKGLYVRARAGQLKGFTGIDDPYEAPENPEIRLDTGTLAVSESVAVVIDWLNAEGYLT